MFLLNLIVDVYFCCSQATYKCVCGAYICSQGKAEMVQREIKLMKLQKFPNFFFNFFFPKKKSKKNLNFFYVFALIVVVYVTDHCY